jgi:hypothetical protein
MAHVLAQIDKPTIIGHQVGIGLDNAKLVRPATRRHLKH